MWKCPKCGAELIQRNLSHSCGSFTVDQFLSGKSARAVALFWLFINEWRKIGRVKLHPVKTSISIMHKVRFARVNRIKRESIVGHLWLKHRVESPKFFRIERLGSSDFVHHFEASQPSFFDEEFRGLMRLAYNVGRRGD